MNKQELLIDKARNLQSYIKQFNPNANLLPYISTFNEMMLIPTITTVVLPLVKTNTLGSAIDDLMKNITVPDERKAEVKAKLVRYLQFFNDVYLM